MKRVHQYLGVGAIALALTLQSLSAEAQTSRYSSWGNPDSTTTSQPSTASAAASSQKQLLDELNKLINEAEKARAADPVFLRDLRALAQRYDSPWQVSIIQDDFMDGNFDQNPTWTVASGRYWIENGYGLRSSVEKAAQTSSTSNTSTTQQNSRQDVAAAIFGAILQSQLGGKSGTSQQAAEPSPSASDPATIFIAQPVTNSFSLRLELASWKADGELGVAMYQGQNRAGGYRLVYRPGEMELQRFGSRGVSVLDRFKSPALEDQKVHVLHWNRTVNGDMTVLIDNQELSRSVDRAFRDKFAGMEVSNRAGDFTLRRVDVLGTK